jgi:hypothetical protein
VVQYIDLKHIVRVLFQRFVEDILPVHSHCSTVIAAPVLYDTSNNAWSGTVRSALIFLELIPLPLSYFKRLLPRVKAKI